MKKIYTNLDLDKGGAKSSFVIEYFQLKIHPVEKQTMARFVRGVCMKIAKGHP